MMQLLSKANDTDATGDAPPLPKSIYVLDTPNGREYLNSLEDAPAGSTHLLYVQSALTKSDSWWYGEGTATLMNRLGQADANPNIDSHIIIFDSPGGTVDGTKDFADAIKSTTKPVVGYVDGMAASAAYWLASSCDEIIASNTTSMVGSIGTMISFVDIRAYYEKEGFKFHDIRADESHEKNEDYYQVLKGNYKPIQSDLLNPMNEIFLDAVRENRPGIAEKTLHGKMYLAADALQYKMIDGVGDFSYALERAATLSAGPVPAGNGPATRRAAAGPRGTTARRTANTSLNSNHNSQSEMSIFKTKFTALVGFFAAMIASEEPVSESSLTEINAELEKLGAEGVTLVADSQLSAHDSQVEALEATIAGQTTHIATLAASLSAAQKEAKDNADLAATYGAQPGATHTEPSKPEGDAEMSEEDEVSKAIAELPHNAELDNNPLFN